ncbi:MAG: hypothetical protein R6U96_09010 [Promethearchaeia archaeon]
MPEVKLKVNDKEIPLNEIMQTVITNINVGFIDSLSGVPDPKRKIELEISPS